jgi:enoyl-CoA hydratase/carnithine racemase
MVEVRREGATTWLSFDRPDKLNAFTVGGYRHLRIELERLADDPGTHVAVLTGHGRAFSAGADRSLLDGSENDPEWQDAGAEFERLLDVLVNFHKPLFAAVNGLAVGFGATMLLYCDVVLIAETARLRMPFTALGVVPEAGSSTLLPERSPWPDAMWAMLSSEWIDAATAVRMGFALRTVAAADLVAQTATAAETVGSFDPDAVAATKRLMTSGRREAVRAAVSAELREMRDLGKRRLPGR